MEYNISTHSNVQRNPTQYFTGLKTWDEVRDFLTNKLDRWCYEVFIYKYSSNHRLLGRKRVTMFDLVNVANSPNDKCLI